VRRAKVAPRSGGSLGPSYRRVVPEFVEVADRVWVARYEWMDVNVTAIGSDRGLVVVDTHGSTAAGRNVLTDLDRLGVRPVTPGRAS
jgi:hypothetical protein